MPVLRVAIVATGVGMVLVHAVADHTTGCSSDQPASDNSGSADERRNLVADVYTRRRIHVAHCGVAAVTSSHLGLRGLRLGHHQYRIRGDSIDASATRPLQRFSFHGSHISIRTLGNVRPTGCGCRCRWSTRWIRALLRRQQPPTALTVINRSMVIDCRVPSPAQEKRPSSST